jgi:F420-0:gamma-glutamyl ligase-like protein
VSMSIVDGNKPEVAGDSKLVELHILDAVEHTPAVVVRSKDLLSHNRLELWQLLK